MASPRFIYAAAASLLSLLAFVPTSRAQTDNGGDGALPSLEEVCAVEYARKTGDTQRTARERWEPAHECRCSQIPSTEFDAYYEIECTSTCDVCGFGRCASSVWSRRFSAEIDDEDGTVTTSRNYQERCVTYTSPADVAGDVACVYTGKGFEMSLNGEFCDREDERHDCPNGERSWRVDCSNVGDDQFDFCVDNAEGLVANPESSRFAFLDDAFGSNECGADSNVTSSPNGGDDPSPPDEGNETPQSPDGGDDPSLYTPALEESICDMEYARETGDSKRTIRERLEPAHECSCSRVSGGEQEEDDDNAPVYEIKCESTCDICGFGKCASSVRRRQFTAEVDTDGAEATVLSTKRVGQSRCLTYTSPPDVAGKVACINEGGDASMTLDGDACSRVDDNELPECPEGKLNLFFDCSNVGDQAFDFCRDNSDGLVPDPTTSLFAFLDNEFISDQCGSAGSGIDLGGLGSFSGRSSGASIVASVSMFLSVFARGLVVCACFMF